MRDCAHNYGPRLALVLPQKLTFAKYMNADDLFEEVHRAMAPHSKESVYNPPRTISSGGPQKHSQSGQCWVDTLRSRRLREVFKNLSCSWSWHRARYPPYENFSVSPTF